jgi:hypothetical protein
VHVSTRLYTERIDGDGAKCGAKFTPHAASSGERLLGVVKSRKKTGKTSRVVGKFCAIPVH